MSNDRLEPVTVCCHRGKYKLEGTRYKERDTGLFGESLKKMATLRRQKLFVPCALCLVPCALCLVPCALCLVPCALCLQTSDFQAHRISDYISQSPVFKEFNMWRTEIFFHRFFFYQVRAQVFFIAVAKHGNDHGILPNLVL